MNLKRLWGTAAVLPLIGLVILAVIVIGIGEILLVLHGTPAVIAALTIMVIITAAAYFLARGPEGDGEHH